MSEKSYNISFESIQVLEKMLLNKRVDITDLFQYQVHAQAAIPDASDMLIMYVAVTILNQSKNNDTLAKILAGFVFKVENLGSVFEKAKTGEFTIPPDLEKALKIMAISTMRGVMYGEFRGTIVDKSVLPIITIDSLIPTSQNIMEPAVS